MRSRKSRLPVGVLLPLPLSLGLLALAVHFHVEPSITAYVLFAVHALGMVVAELVRPGPRQ